MLWLLHHGSSNPEDVPSEYAFPVKTIAAEHLHDSALQNHRSDSRPWPRV